MIYNDQNWGNESMEAFSVDDEWNKIANKGNSIPEEPEPEFNLFGTVLNEI